MGLSLVLEATQEHIDRIAQLSDCLLEYFGVPTWHGYLAPVDELVNTFLSQNTTDVNRDKAYDALKARYASWEEVRDADAGEFQQVIRVAGLAAQKGPNIQNALKRLSAERGEISLDWLKAETLEDARAWLCSLRGVGQKTAAIVLLFSLGMPAFPVDTHIYRVSGRIGLRPSSLDVDATHRYLERTARPEVFGPLHLNIISLGRQFCQARRPKCAACPARSLCVFEEKTEL